MNLSFFLLFRNMALTYEKYSFPEKYSRLWSIFKDFLFRESSSSGVAATHIIVQLLQPSRCPV